MWRRYLAEFLGTFAYVFFGCGTRILAGSGQDAASRLLVYFTFGYTLLALTYALSHFSGAPFNPATTLSLALSLTLLACPGGRSIGSDYCPLFSAAGQSGPY